MIAVVGRDSDEMRLGVVVGVEKLALELLLPGTVMEMREEGALGLLGVTGGRLAVPSLVVGLLPLLLLDIADAERRGGDHGTAAALRQRHQGRLQGALALLGRLEGTHRLD